MKKIFVKKHQEICKVNLSKHSIDFETKYFDSYPLPFNDDEFETILSFETIEHLPIQKFLSKNYIEY